MQNGGERYSTILPDNTMGNITTVSLAGEAQAALFYLFGLKGISCVHLVDLFINAPQQNESHIQTSCGCRFDYSTDRIGACILLDQGRFWRCEGQDFLLPITLL